MSNDARRRILERRARFVAAALSSFAVAGGGAFAAGCEDDTTAEAEPCLTVGPDTGFKSDTRAEACLGITAPDTTTIDTGDTSVTDATDATDAD